MFLSLFDSRLRQTAVARGDLTQKITDVSVSGEMLSLVNTINDMIGQLAISRRRSRRSLARSEWKASSEFKPKLVTSKVSGRRLSMFHLLTLEDIMFIIF